ncbi:hypothetical protein HNQ59_001264 [Chitinivorax tropicus]|uniref:Transmembrane protein n=1 Tax=Chitinivorax tropicus TaxID=714531 RepID=A0A840MLG9_9PROT|nr:hypothetical protein [Chitinivorax tropicus]MBB5017979.1 hypothetical protein [Chitinivorax tropicus]
MTSENKQEEGAQINRILQGLGVNDTGNVKVEVKDISKTNLIQKGFGVTEEAPPITKIGYRLSTFVLSMVIGAGLLLIFMIGVQELWIFPSQKQQLWNTITRLENGPLLTTCDPRCEKLIETTKLAIEALSKQHQEARQFYLQLLQIILLNMLLPLVTALFGYIFGSKQAESKG